MSKPFLLRGIDGSNPLGFLAAVGTLRMLTGSRLGWSMEAGVWQPLLTVAGLDSENDICERLAERARLEPMEVRMLGKNLTVEPELYSAYVDKAAQLLSAGDAIARLCQHRPNITLAPRSGF